MEHLKLSTLYSAEEIRERVEELGAQIAERFKGEELTVICVLKGSIMFYSDLIRAIDMDIKCDYIGASSYLGGTESSGEVKMTLDLSFSVKDRNVLIVEDIVDTGITLDYLQKSLGARQPKTVTTAALLSKPDAHRVETKVEYLGFTISNEFVVGYGLDYQGYYRNLPYIAKVQNLN